MSGTTPKVEHGWEMLETDYVYCTSKLSTESWCAEVFFVSVGAQEQQSTTGVPVKPFSFTAALRFSDLHHRAWTPRYFPISIVFLGTHFSGHTVYTENSRYR